MKQFITVFLASLLTFTAAQAETNALQKVCAKSGPEKKFVIKLYKVYSQLCILGDYQENGETCGVDTYWVERSGMEKIVGSYAWSIENLNNDKHFDLILSYDSGGMWTGAGKLRILASCGDNTYIEVFNGGFSGVWAGTVDKETGMAQLNAIQLSIRDGVGGNFGGDADDLNVQEFVLKLNPDTFRYQIIQEGEIKRVIEKDEGERIPPLKPPVDFVWDKFPASIPLLFAPSFDCAKASTKVEKGICSTGNLSRLDKALAANYKQIVAENEDQRAQLTIEQRAWLKQRSTCYSDGDDFDKYTGRQCLFDAYIQRVDELCTKYPLKSGTCISSEEAMKTSRE